MLRLVCSIVALACLSACATTPIYGPALSPRGAGFSERQIEADRWSVTFRGGGATARDTVENALLLRAADLTLEKGFDHFIIAARATDAEKRLTPSLTGTPRSFFFEHYWYSPRGGWRTFGDPFWNDREYREITRFEARAEIVMARGPKPAGNPQAFDAREVRANLSGAFAPRVQ
jgi:hypothetical protein